MRAITTLALGVALSLAVAFAAFVTPSQAEAPYSVDTVVAIFVKDKAVAEAYKRGTRSICLEDAVDCQKKRRALEQASTSWCVSKTRPIS